MKILRTKVVHRERRLGVIESDLHDLAVVAEEFGVDLDDDEDWDLAPVKVTPAPPDDTDW